MLLQNAMLRRKYLDVIYALLHVLITQSGRVMIIFYCLIMNLVKDKAISKNIPFSNYEELLRS